MIGHGIGSHAPGVRPEVTVKSTFMVLDKGHGYHVIAINKRLQGELLPDKALLEHHPAVQGFDICDGAWPVNLFSHDPHTFSPGKPDRFDNEIFLVVIDK